jgi:2'-5' RNA ligase
VSRDRGWVDPYAGMAGQRLFVAVPLPDDAVRAVVEVVDEVRAMPLPEGMRDVRWVRMDGLHLTLRFLGPTAPERVAPTAAAVTAASATHGPIDLTIAEAGSFPPGPRPRALWLGLTAGAAELTRLAASLDQGLAEAGWPTDRRPIRPHLTLARSDGMAAGPLVAARLAEAMAGRAIEATASAVGLFESVTGGGPARYLQLAAATLHDAG